VKPAAAASLSAPRPAHSKMSFEMPPFVSGSKPNHLDSQTTIGTFQVPSQTQDLNFGSPKDVFGDHGRQQLDAAAAAMASRSNFTEDPSFLLPCEDDDMRTLEDILLGQGPSTYPPRLETPQGEIAAAQLVTPDIQVRSFISFNYGTTAAGISVGGYSQELNIPGNHPGIVAVALPNEREGPPSVADLLPAKQTLFNEGPIDCSDVRRRTPRTRRSGPYLRKAKSKDAKKKSPPATGCKQNAKSNGPSKKKSRGPRAPVIPPDQRQRVDDYNTATDILLGRGGRTNRNPGNKAYRGVIRPYQADYQSLKRPADKTEFSKEVLRKLREEHNLRFLDKDSYGHYLAHSEKARLKISQALRETWPNRGGENNDHHQEVEEEEEEEEEDASAE
jgi:hypothetical protein